MKKLIAASILLFAIFQTTIAQMDLPPSGGNPRATISEEVGITSITIKYSRPDVNGREGKIWGTLITYGFTSQNLNTNKNDMPWRAGANETTTITFEHDLKVEGKDIKAGTYGLYMAVYPDKATVIFSKQADNWGSFFYEEKNDVLRVDVKPVALDKSVEWLKYEFIEQREKYCVIALQWEKLSIPFRVDVDVDNIVLARMRDQVAGQRGFNPLLLTAAANYFINKNIDLDEALAWSQRAASFKSFSTLNTLGTAYTKLNRLKEADSTMNEALVFAVPGQFQAYGRSLVTAKRLDRWMEVLNAAQKKNGDVFMVNAGYMSYYSAKGDFKKALDYANKALAQAPNDAAKTAMNGNIAKLKEGKDINQ
jgi:tetratricopeptide (TPR) repeat protein